MAEGYVYFLHAPAVARVKIGFSDDPERRFRDIRGNSPVPLAKLGVLPGDCALEASLQGRWSAYWSHFEWFHASGPLMEFIRDHAHPWPGTPQPPPSPPPPVRPLVDAGQLAQRWDCSPAEARARVVRGGMPHLYLSTTTGRLCRRISLFRVEPDDLEAWERARGIGVGV